MHQLSSFTGCVCDNVALLCVCVSIVVALLFFSAFLFLEWTTWRMFKTIHLQFSTRCITMHIFRLGYRAFISPSHNVPGLKICISMCAFVCALFFFVSHTCHTITHTFCCVQRISFMNCARHLCRRKKLEQNRIQLLLSFLSYFFSSEFDAWKMINCFRAQHSIQDHNCRGSFKNLTNFSQVFLSLSLHLGLRIRELFLIFMVFVHIKYFGDLWAGMLWSIIFLLTNVPNFRIWFKNSLQLHVSNDKEFKLIIICS